MAEDSTENSSEQQSARRFGPRNRTIPAVMVALAILLLVIGLVAKKKSPPANPGGRTVIVPTADRARAVVVPPCGTGVAVTPANAATQAGAPGAIRLELPQGSGVRMVVVPRCQNPRGSVASEPANLPSAAFVLAPGKRPPPAGSEKSKTGDSSFLSGIHAQLIVPEQSEIRTVVVPPCPASSKSSEEREVVLRGEVQGAGTAVAPAC